MFKTLLRLFNRDSTSKTSRYDPVYGLPTRAVNDWLRYNPDLKKVYEATLQARLRRRGMENSALSLRTETGGANYVSGHPLGTSKAAANTEEASESIPIARRRALRKSARLSGIARFESQASRQTCV